MKKENMADSDGIVTSKTSVFFARVTLVFMVFLSIVAVITGNAWSIIVLHCLSGLGALFFALFGSNHRTCLWWNLRRTVGLILGMVWGFVALTAVACGMFVPKQDFRSIHQ